MVSVNNRENSVTPLPFTVMKKKGKSQTMTPTLPRSLPQEKKKPKSKKTPTKTQRNKQLAGTRLPSTQLDEGTRKSQLSPEGKKSDPKDLVGNNQPIDMGFPFMASDKGTVKTMPLPEGSPGDKDSERLKPPADMEPLTNPIADPSGTGAKYQESDNEEMFAAGEEMDEDIPPTDEEARSSPPNKEQPKPSHTQESDSDSSSLELKKYDSTLQLTKRKLFLMLTSRHPLKGIVKRMLITRIKLTSLFRQPWIALKNSIERADLLKALNEVTKTLKVVQEAIKDDHPLNRMIIEATESYTKNSTSLVRIKNVVSILKLH
ncbi:hypothetical protein Tco_0777869 [Tanacetum coccineum]